MKRYKYVINNKGILRSSVDPNFVYIIGETALANITDVYSGIYCFNDYGIEQVSEKTKRDFVLLELEVKEQDLLRQESETVFVYKKVEVIKIIN